MTHVARASALLGLGLLVAGTSPSVLPFAGATASAQVTPAANEFDDSHFHLTNYIQQGIEVRQFLQIMGTRVQRSTLFGIPLQQQWSYANYRSFRTDEACSSRSFGTAEYRRSRCWI